MLTKRPAIVPTGRIALPFLFLFVAIAFPASVQGVSSVALRSAELTQQGVSAKLVVRTDSTQRAGVLCARQLSPADRPLKDICVEPKGKRSVVQVRRLTSSGAVRNSRAIHAEVDARKGGYAATFLLVDAGIEKGLFRWQARTETGAQLPASGVFETRFRRLAGCVAHGNSFRRSGSGNRVALTFDDGPSSYTPGFVDLLARKHVPGTFFVVGNNVGGRGAILQRALAQGNAIGNHSLAHGQLPGVGDLGATNHIIEKATGYRPCVFRPPYGLVNGSVIGGARSLKMLTIEWDVDPSDYRTPGAGTIAARVLGATHAGSIVLMHDGGGPRSQSLAALGQIIDKLKKRGYELVTVPELLGLAPRYG